MSFFSKLFNSSTTKSEVSFNTSHDDYFDPVEYEKYNNERIEEFKNRYDLSSVAGIRAIKKEEARRYPDGGRSVVYMPEQILSRQATEYKKDGKYDLAIACLKKVNELYPYSFYHYTRDNYERLVDTMVLAGRYDEARKEHKKLDEQYGTRIEELQHLQKMVAGMGTESEESYQERVINPHIEEEKDRECYYWILENIPNIAPKSFGGFRRIKKLNSDSYKNIVKEVENTGNDINTLKFWE